MKRFLSLTLCLVMVLAVGSAQATANRTNDVDVSDLQIVVDGEGTVLHSTTSSQNMLMRVSGPDTFDLYGGDGVGRPNAIGGAPGFRGVLRNAGTPNEYVEGKFQNSTGFAPAGLQPLSTWDGTTWVGVDLTDQPTYWQRSQFNAQNLGTTQPTPNNAYWSGLDATSPLTAGWENVPGYGNNWNDNLLFEIPVSDPAQGQTVGLDFYFNYETEGGYDFFEVQYDSAGTWISVYSISGTSRDVGGTGLFNAPGVQYSTLTADPIVYAGNDYGIGTGAALGVPAIRIRLQFNSDGAFSDQDGLFVGEGAAQVDQLTVTSPTEGTFAEDFEGAAPYLWVPDKNAFAGDFSDVFPGITDIDPCATNVTPMVGFIDYGQAPPNGPGVDGTVSTGGQTSGTWNYGIPTANVFNFNGGLSGGSVPINNEVWSPEFAWDVAGTTVDDDPEFAGSALYFTVWRHNPLANGIFYVWHVRSETIDPNTLQPVWGPWEDRNFVYFSSTGEYLPTLQNTTDLIPQGVQRVQLAVGGLDLSATFGFPGTDATPAPMFDDIRFYKFRVGGISMSTRTIDLAQDGFPVNGSIDASTAAARGALDVRFDMARDVSSGDVLAPGDSVVINAQPVIPGTTIQQIVMKWALLQNPLFSDPGNRVQPARPVDSNFASAVDGSGRTIWTGDVLVQNSTTALGNPVNGVYFGDLPDIDFLYPGDILHYYFEATDSDGRVSTLPGNTDGFGVWDANRQSDFTRTYTVRALPTITDAAGAQPSILLYNDFGRRGGEAEFVSAFNQLALFEGVQWDSYTTQGPSSGVSNGIGSAGVTGPIADGDTPAAGNRRGHGANQQQLDGYSTIIYLSGNLNTQLISDGSDVGQNDKSPDILTLTGWKNLAGQRNTVYFGDFIGSALVNDSPVEGQAYVTNVMGISVVSSNVRSEIGGQTAPVVRPTGTVAAFVTDFIAYGGCFGINQFDSIRAGGASVVGHGFVNPANNTVYPDIAASTVFDRLAGLDRKVDIVFPYGDLYIYDNVSRAPVGASTRTILLEEILSYLGESVPGPGPAVAAPALRAASLSLFPNPFNPKTTVQFALPKAGMDATVKVFNVRGELVKTLHSGVATSADLNLEWNGTDERGSSVASGLYLVKAVTEGFSDTKKAVLVK